MKNWHQYLLELCGDYEHCDCGRVHTQSIDHVEIGLGAIFGIGQYCRQRGWYRPTVVADPITFEAGFDKVKESLDSAGIQATTVVLRAKSRGLLVPDEAAIGRLLMETPGDTDVMLGLGSGTISDLVRYVAARLHLPFVSVPTAPSMDGYASSVAPLHLGKFKKTFPAAAPLAIFADTQIFASAPPIMIAAGFGDIVGKLTARFDWQIAHLVIGEHYCETPLRLMNAALSTCLSNASKIGQGDAAIIAALMEALILSGVAIMLNGNSRPASGPEHLLAHYWEVQHGMDGKPDALHGVKVGVATPIAITFTKELLGRDLSELQSDVYPDYSQRVDLIRTHYRDAAESVLQEGTKKWLSAEKLQAVRQVIAKNWPTMQELVKQLPDPVMVSEWLQAGGCPTRIDEIGITRDELRNALLYSKEMRARFTVFDLADYLGCLPVIVDATLDELSRLKLI